jgi:dTDP-D-glucose 4,6-dehydratase
LDFIKAGNFNLTNVEIGDDGNINTVAVDIGSDTVIHTLADTFVDKSIIVK